MPVRTYLTGLVMVFFLDAPETLNAQDRSHARSMVITQKGIVATSQTLASLSGTRILGLGGSAVDAAIAANAVLTVVEPMMNGIGGDLFVLYRESSGRVSGLNASGPAPAGLTPDLLGSRGINNLSNGGIHAVTVPGAVAGWAEMHARHGRLPWKGLFEDAIRYAENGFPVTEIISSQWKSSTRKLEDNEYAGKVFLPAPAVGQIFRNPDLGRALRLIAEKGASGFYDGPLAEAILATSKKLGGTLASSDLKSFRPEWVQPLQTTYRGWRVYELPPNSQGLAALSMLNLMELFDFTRFAPLSPEATHWRIESQKLAYADLSRYVADPRVSKVPAAGLIDKNYARKRAGLIDPNSARCEPAAGEPLPSAGDTIYLSVVDAEGNIASWIQSIYLGFGSGIAVPGFGFHLHNRGALFTLEKGHPNQLAPGKRPFHTIIPAYMETDQYKIGFGIMGGLNQAQAHAQFVSYLVDGGLNLQAALEAPRFTRTSFTGCEVLLESRFPAATQEALAKRGHQLKMMGDYSNEMGGGQAVLLDTRTNVKFGASSPRKDGAALPQP